MHELVPVVLRDLFGDRPLGAIAIRVVAQDGYVLVQTDERTMRVCDWPSGRTRRELLAPAGGRWHLGEPGGWVADSGPDGSLRVWDAREPAVTQSYEGSGLPLTSVRRTPGYVVAIEGEKAVVAWREGHSAPVWRMTFPAEVQFLGIRAEPSDLVVVLKGGQASAWRLPDFSQLAERQLAASVQEWALSPDGRVLIGKETNNDYSELWAWEMPSGTLRYYLDELPGQLWGLAFSPDGRYFTMASTWADDELFVHAVDTGACRTVLPVSGIQYGFTPDGRLLVDVDWTLGVWETQGFEEVASFSQAVEWTPVTFDISDDGRYLAFGGAGTPLRVLDLGAKQFIDNEGTLKAYLETSALSADGTMWLTANSEGLFGWPVAGGEPTRHEVPEANPRGFDPTGRRVALTAGGTLGVWDLAARTWLGRVKTPGLEHYPWPVSIGASGEMLAFICQTGEPFAPGAVRLWRLGKEEQEWVAETPMAFGDALAIDPTETLVAAEYRRGEVGLFAIASGDLVATLGTASDDRDLMHFWRGLAFSPAGDALYAIGADGVVRQWRLGDRSLLGTRAFEDAYAIAVAPDTGWIAVVCTGMCYVLEHLDGPVVAAIPGPTMAPVVFRGDLLAVGPRLYKLGHHLDSKQG